MVWTYNRRNCIKIKKIKIKKIKITLDFPVNVCYIYEVTAEDSRCRKA